MPFLEAQNISPTVSFDLKWKNNAYDMKAAVRSS